ncbi:MAG: hypothetical protein OFPI_41260 [Osedax symbiont Rs2]|nr:MAG: hypothetical protein OFPI_41260 [Osedax symbiont Rs2]
MNQKSSSIAKHNIDNQLECWNILCVDDEQNILNALKRVLRGQQFKVYCAHSAELGLSIMTEQPIDLVICDMRMGAMDGVQMLTEVLKLYPETVRILLTGYADKESTIAAVNVGQVHRYLEKPWDNRILLEVLEQELSKLQLQRQNRQNRQLSEQIEIQNQQLIALNHNLEDKVKLRTEQIQMALDKLTNARDKSVADHRATLQVFYNLLSSQAQLGGKKTRDISQLCVLLANKLQLPSSEVMQIKLAGLLHQLGLLCVDSELYQKPFERLNAQQQKLYLSHPLLAFRAMAPVRFLALCAEIILHQHRDFNSGDPALRGASILAIARDYIAAVSGTEHSIKLSPVSALERLHSAPAGQYDPDILAHLPALISQLDQQLQSDDEQLLAVRLLAPHMSLSRDLFNHQDLLLLSEGHVLTAACIERLNNYIDVDHPILSVFVFKGCKASLIEAG